MIRHDESRYLSFIFILSRNLFSFRVLQLRKGSLCIFPTEFNLKCFRSWAFQLDFSVCLVQFSYYVVRFII